MDQFKKDKKARQSIQVLKEGDVLIKKHLVKIMIIDTPIEYDGCQWAHSQPSTPNSDAYERNPSVEF